jgi:hypothetical protein
MERMAKEKFIKDLEEALKRAEERGFKPEETQEERNARFDKMTPKEKEKAIIAEIFEFSGEGFLTEEEEKECTYE